MKTKFKERLLALYKHMNQPQKNLAHKKFDFNIFNDGFKEKNECGTSGCMAGELPAVFPRSWGWSRFNVYLKNNSSGITVQDLAIYFGLTGAEMRHLFIPGGQSDFIDPNCETLPPEAKRAEVVANLKRFLKLKQIL